MGTSGELHERKSSKMFFGKGGTTKQLEKKKEVRAKPATLTRERTNLEKRLEGKAERKLGRDCS